MKRQNFAMILCLSAVAAILATSAMAQSVASLTCDNFKSANGPQKELFTAYIQGYANASSPDPRYTQSDSALADDVKKVHDWCGKNGKRSFNEAVAAVLGSASSSGGGTSAQAAAQEPTACKAGPSQYCGGCSITCNGGKQATCKQGTDSPFGKPECEFQARCWCK
ncbi:MAG: HdeA/HdeB family chaperone [Candidatus Korobacteraceae bacterium]